MILAMFISLQLSEDARQVTQMQPGLATSPALFASEECPRLLPLIQRNFRNSGDLEEVRKCLLSILLWLLTLNLGF